MTILTDPTKWESDLGISPPIWWEAVETDDRYWFYDNQSGGAPSDPTRVTCLTPSELDGLNLTLAWEVTTAYTDTITLRYAINGGAAVDTVLTAGGQVGSGELDISFPASVTAFYFELRTDSSDRIYGGVVAIGDAPPPPTCEEIGHATRAYVSAYDRSRVHQARLYRFEKRCLIANFNGAIQPARTITSATWRTDAPEIGVISNPQISTDARETMMTFASQLGGWANLRCEVTLDNGEIYNQVFRVNVREASYFFNDPPSQVGPFSVTVTAV